MGARVAMMNFHLGEYYFRRKDFYQATSHFEKTDVKQLSNREVADMQFHQGYAYFNLQQFDKAKPLLDEIRRNPKDPNYVDANYFYGFISFGDRKYNEALSGFRVAENAPQYEKVVPFYIGTILYNTGQKDKGLEYAESRLKKGGQVYDLELRQLVGHAYFERKEYDKALPYLEDYV